MLKSLFISLTLVPVLAALQNKQLPPVPFTIAISTASQMVKSGHSIPIHVVLTSTSKKTITLGHIVNTNQGELDYIVRVHTVGGVTPHLTVYGQHVVTHHIDIISSQIITLHEGQQIEDNLSLDHMYDITEPGKYILQLLRPENAESERLVSSNELVITVK